MVFYPDRILVVKMYYSGLARPFHPLVFYGIGACLAARAGDIDRMREDGVIDDHRAVLFKGRAEALCVAQEGRGSDREPAGAAGSGRGQV